MADCSLAITVALRSVCGECTTRLYLWFHEISAIRKKLGYVQNKEFLNEIDEQLSEIQLSLSKYEFIHATNMLIEYWRGSNPEIDVFLTYFHKIHVEQNNLWYEGATIGVPSSNSAIERHIKDHGTFRMQELTVYFL